MSIPLNPRLRRCLTAVFASIAVARVHSFASDIRKMIYTANSVESLHMQLRKHQREHFPKNETALNLSWLTLRNAIANGSVHITIGKVP